MDTPWGPLAELDTDDTDLSSEIICEDKHALVEGLVVECLFDQIVSSIPQHEGGGVIMLDVETAVIDSLRPKDRWLSFVWARSMQPGLGRYLMALERFSVPFLITYEDGEFYAVAIHGGVRQGEKTPLHELMMSLSGSNKSNLNVSATVRRKDRQRAAFWGFISDYYKKDLWNKVVLTRILLNHGLQPFFKHLWNIDRVFIVNSDVWVSEVKHKFPMDYKTLQFGLNDGETQLLSMLTSAEIRCLHTIVVKPRWDKNIGPLYLFNDIAMRARAAVIATVLDKNMLSSLTSQRSRTSASHTSITGRSELKYKSMNATDFRILGCVSTPVEEIAKKMIDVMNGTAVKGVSDEWLRDLRFED